MTARCIPEDPTFASGTERQVWERLREGLSGECILLANQRLTDQERDYEADLVVLVPEASILVLEVKGGSVSKHGDQWWVERGGGPEHCWPVEQALTCKHRLRGYVEADPRWGSGHVAWAHGVVLPHTRLGHDFEVKELPRWAFHGRDDLDDLPARVRENARGLDHRQPVPSQDDVELVAEILAGRHLPTRDLNALAEVRQAEADRLTQEQMTVLQVTRLLRRVEVRGGAGSGKTVLALQKAKDLARGRGEGQRPERVALLCYSIGLAQHLKREVAGWDRRQRPAFVGTYEDLGRQWGIEMSGREDSGFWEERLPRLMAEQAAELPPGHRFDSVVVDEAQDFADTWWSGVLAALTDQDEGGLFVFSDENQRLFARYGAPPVSLLPLVLDHNLRNTKQICQSFAPLAPSRMKALGGEGEAVRFVPTTVEDAVEAADGQVEALLGDGWESGKVALLTTGSRHPVQLELFDPHDPARYWESFWAGEDIFFGHVLGAKGLERPVVVLCVNEDGGRDRARERLYVGMSRATDLLVVVGDPDVVRRMGGAQVARQLGL